MVPAPFKKEKVEEFKAEVEEEEEEKVKDGIGFTGLRRFHAEVME